MPVTKKIFATRFNITAIDGDLDKAVRIALGLNVTKSTIKAKKAFKTANNQSVKALEAEIKADSMSDVTIVTMSKVTGIDASDLIKSQSAKSTYTPAVSVWDRLESFMALDLAKEKEQAKKLGATLAVYVPNTVEVAYKKVDKTLDCLNDPFTIDEMASNLVLTTVKDYLMNDSEFLSFIDNTNFNYSRLGVITRFVRMITDELCTSDTNFLFTYIDSKGFTATSSTRREFHEYFTPLIPVLIRERLAYWKSKGMIGDEVIDIYEFESRLSAVHVDISKHIAPKVAQLKIKFDPRYAGIYYPTLGIVVDAVAFAKLLVKDIRQGK